MNDEQRDEFREISRDEFREISDLYAAAMKEIENEQEVYWKSLSKDDQLKAFCAVSRRIHKAELVDKGSYRWVLYDVFGFGPESYTQGMECGYMTIHNAIMDPDCGMHHDLKTISAFCKANNLDVSKEKIMEYLL